MDYPSFYHVFNRGVDRRLIFTSEREYELIYKLFQRYLGSEVKYNKDGQPYPNYRTSIKLLSFCLMPNHFHLEIEEIEVGALSKFMQSLKGAYCRSFNLINERTGVLFETRYHRKKILDTGGILNVSRYIHLNPLAITPSYENYQHSSLQYYLDKPPPEWLSTERVKSLIDSPKAHHQFHEDYVREQAALHFSSLTIKT
jgi:putative transposase